MLPPFGEDTASPPWYLYHKCGTSNSLRENVRRANWQPSVKSLASIYQAERSWKTRKDGGTVPDWRKPRRYDNETQCNISNRCPKQEKSISGKTGKMQMKSQVVVHRQRHGYLPHSGHCTLVTYAVDAKDARRRDMRVSTHWTVFSKSKIVSK